MKSLIRNLFLIAILLIGGWITYNILGLKIEIEKTNTANIEKEIPLGGEWKLVDEIDDVWRIEWIFDQAETAKMIIYRLPIKNFSFHFEHGEAKKISDWTLGHENLALAINGTYFHEDMLPSGLLITKKERIGDREFDLDKTGLIRLQPNLAILDTTTEIFDQTQLIEAAQTFPFLIKNGVVDIKKESGLNARRSFFGLDKDGNAYFGVVPNRSISLFKLAQILKNIEADWDDVINLDGGPSNGIYANFPFSKETLDSFTPVPNVILVERQ